MQINKVGCLQRGAVMVEYSIVTLVVVMVLFLPLPGLQDSLITTVMDALRQFQSHTMLLLSLP
ncbi:MAG: hypothetical protein ACI9XK_004765 [Granulosicoccus sp.]|jgi:hypothetical protein